jgi:hypothetical protein
MAISFVFVVIFLVIQTCGKVQRTQVAFCVKSCVVLNHTPCLLSFLHSCVQHPCAPIVWDRGWHGEHAERHALCQGAHDTHPPIHLAALPEQFHIRRGPSSIFHDKLVACPAPAQIPGQ